MPKGCSEGGGAAGRIALTEAEWKVIELMWEKAPRTITQLTAALQESQGWAKGTVIKFLERMEKKGAVAYEEGGRARQYYPLISRAEARLGETEGFLSRVYHGSVAMMVNTMAEGGALSGEELEELYAILERVREVEP